MPEPVPSAPLKGIAEIANEGGLLPARPEDQDVSQLPALQPSFAVGTPGSAAINKGVIASKFPDKVDAFVGKRFIQLPPDQAQKALDAGAIQLPANQDLHFRMADGSYKVVPANQANQHRADGGTLVSAREHHQADLAAQLDTGVGSGIAATALGAARGLSTVTGGGSISDALTDVLGGAEGVEKAQYLKEHRALLSGIGQAGGMIAQAGLTPGGGLAGLTERGAVGVAGKGLAGRVVTQAAKGAVEMAQLEHADQVGEQALGAPELTAEKYLANEASALWQGAAFGAGGELVGTALGAAKRGIVGALTREAKPADIDAVAAKAFGDAPKSGGVGEALVKAQAFLSGADAEGTAAIRNAGVQNLSPEAKALRATALNIDEVRAGAVKDLTGNMDNLLKKTDALTDEVKGVTKTENLKNLGGSVLPTEEVQAHAMDSLQEVRNKVGEMMQDPDTFGNEGALKKIDRVLQQHEKAMVAAVEKGDQAEMYAVLDDTKRTIGAYSKKAQVAASRSSGLLDTMQARELFQKLGDVDHGGGIYEGLRKNLEEEAIWGKPAAAQKAINAAWTEHIAASKALNETGASVTSKVGERNFGQAIYGADPAKMEKYVGGLVNRSNDLQHQAMARYTASTRDLAKVIDEHLALTPEKQAMVTAVKAASHQMDMGLTDIGDKLVKVNQIKALIDASRGSAGSIGAGMLGHFVGGPVGSIVGALGGGLASPGKNIMRLAQLEQATRSFDQKMGGAVSRFFSRGEKAAAGEGGASVGARVKRAAQTVNRGRQEGERDSVRAEYEKNLAALTPMADPNVLNERMAPHYERLQGTAPQTASALGGKAATAVGYLLSKLPATEPADPLTGKPGIPSFSEMVRLNTQARTIKDPDSFARDLEHGRVTIDQVDAFRGAFPAAFEELQGNVQKALIEHAQAGKPVSFQQRVTLGLLLDIETDPSLSKASMSHADATYGTAPVPPDKPPGNGGRNGNDALSKGNAMTTPAQRMSTGL